MRGAGEDRLTLGLPLTEETSGEETGWREDETSREGSVRREDETDWEGSARREDETGGRSARRGGARLAGAASRWGHREVSGRQRARSKQACILFHLLPLILPARGLFSHARSQLRALLRGGNFRALARCLARLRVAESPPRHRACLGVHLPPRPGGTTSPST